MTRLVCPTLAAACLLALTGCGTLPEVPADFEFGPPPPNAQERVEAYYQTTLRDPDSARYEHGETFKGRCAGDPISEIPAWLGWASNVSVNAKNGFGGYTGYKDYTLLFAPDDSVARVIEGSGFGYALCERM